MDIKSASLLSFTGTGTLRQVIKKTPKAKKVIAEELPDFFRDGELFNSQKDIVTNDYFRYGNNDIAGGENFTDDRPYQVVVDLYRECLENGREYY